MITFAAAILMCGCMLQTTETISVLPADGLIWGTGETKTIGYLPEYPTPLAKCGLGMVFCLDEQMCVPDTDDESGCDLDGLFAPRNIKQTCADGEVFCVELQKCVEEEDICEEELSADGRSTIVCRSTSVFCPEAERCLPSAAIVPQSGGSCKSDANTGPAVGTTKKEVDLKKSTPKEEIEWPTATTAAQKRLSDEEVQQRMEEAAAILQKKIDGFFSSIFG